MLVRAAPVLGHGRVHRDERMTDRDDRTEASSSGRGHRAARRVGRLWWIGVVRGAIALALGASALVAGESGGRLATFVALYWLTGGVVTMRFAMATRLGRGFRLASFAGGVAIIASVLVLVRGLLSNVVSPNDVVDVLGFAAAAMGALRLVGAFEVEQRTGHRWTIGGIVLGGLELAMGILLIATESRSRGTMVAVGAWALASGTLLIIQAFRVRRLAGEVLGSGEASPGLG
jgi:uncharacterized membrane protein HdeD (DUF308 family)